MDTSSSSQSSGRQGNTLVTKVKGLLMRAWRERWNEVQWGIQLKKTINSVQGADTRDLAELLLQQSLVGSHPNSLILTYIKHAVFSQVVPVTAAFKYIVGYEDYNRPHCLLALVEVTQEFAVHMNFNSGTDGGMMLCKSIQAVIYWLLKVMLKAVQRFLENRQPEYQSVLHTAAIAAQKITESSTVRGLLYVARSEDADTFREMEQTELNVRGTLSQIPPDVIPSQVRQDVSSLSFLSNVKDMVLPSDPVLDVSHLPICPTIVTMVALEAVLNPTNDVQPFVDQLFALEKLMKLQRPYVFCELFRACFMGLVDIKGGDSQEQYRWCAFTFLKLPQVLLKIQQQSPSRDFSAELEKGFDRLLNSSCMLDLADIKHNCDCLIFLLNECTKVSLLSDAQHQRLSHRRINESQKPRTNEGPATQPCTSLIIRAEPTVHSILKTLDADYSKNQEALLVVLHHMLSGKSFELILAAAAATGKLQIFCFKLIKFNEFAKQSPGEGGKAAQTRALLFDITFLMLCHITQVYGTEMITSGSECMDTFFVQWALRCLPEDGKYKSVDLSMAVDSVKVDFLLNAFTSGTDISQGVPKWHEICINSPHAIQEVLFAWEHGALSSDKIKMILNYVKNRMLCLPVVVLAWLCSYINMLSDEARTKPQSMLQELKQPITSDNVPQYYAERTQLMQLIVQKMTHDILPPSMRTPSPQYVPAESLPADVMAKTMKTVFGKGWVDLNSLHTLEALVNLCGSDWFTDRLVHHMLESYRIEDLTLHLSIVFAITHMDLEHITLSLLLHTMPALLLSSEKQSLLTDPRGYTLAKLCVLAITAAQTAKSAQKESSVLYRRGRKRSRKEFDIEDLDDLDTRPPQKRSKTMEPQITLDSEGFNFDFLNPKEDGEASPTIDVKDPLNKALINLFRLMNAIAHDGDISPRTNFIVSFIDEAVRCGNQHSRYILQFMPNNMLSQILKSIPGVFQNENILQICDLYNNTGRKIAAKAICQNSRFTND